MIRYTYAPKDYICSLCLTIFLLIVAAGSLTSGVTHWGDDFAAYLNEGFAIADGCFDEQAKLNFRMHPTNLTAEASPKGLVYVWGYPLMLSVIYRFVGFDRNDYTDIIWYKLPQIFSLALLGGILFLFYKRRFSLQTSLLLSLLLCLDRIFYTTINRLHCDLPFLFLSMLTFLLGEIYAEITTERIVGHEGKFWRWIPICFLYAAVLWLTYETRLNGSTVCLAVFLGHAIFLIRDRKMFQDKRSLLIHAIPYAGFLSLTWFTQNFLFAAATSNMSDVGKANGTLIISHIQEYYELILEFFESLLSFPRAPWIGSILAVFCLLGLITDTFPYNFHISVLLVGTFVVLVLLPYTQGLRYLFNCLPFLLMFCAYGIGFCWKKLRKLEIFSRIPPKVTKAVGIVAVIMILFFPLEARIENVIKNRASWGTVGRNDVYSPDAIEIYGYIQKNLPKEAVIAFAKPRALYLNTGRLSFHPLRNGHSFKEADYYLQYELPVSAFEKVKRKAAKAPLEEVYSNDSFTLFKVLKAQKSSKQESRSK